MKGIKRFRQAIKNQLDTGEGEFRLTYHDAEEIATEIEGELESLSWAAGVPAPKDADGEVVPLTTRVMYGDDGRKLEVSSFKLWNEPYAMQWRASCTNKDGGMGYGDVSNLHLHRPDSWERLDEDVKQFEDGGTACEYFGSELTSCNECKSLGSIGANCRNSVTLDVLRRAKALAERDAKAHAGVGES